MNRRAFLFGSAAVLTVVASGVRVMPSSGTYTGRWSHKHPNFTEVPKGTGRLRTIGTTGTGRTIYAHGQNPAAYHSLGVQADNLLRDTVKAILEGRNFDEVRDMQHYHTRAGGEIPPALVAGIEAHRAIELDYASIERRVLLSSPELLVGIGAQDRQERTPQWWRRYLNGGRQ